MAQFNVLMFGSRRAGKSSVLSSMIDSFEALKSTTANNITLTATDDTADILKKKKADLKSIFEMEIHDPMKWVIDVGGNRVSDTYEFTMSAPGSENHMLCFKDIPGEWLMTKEAALKKELKQSQIIIIAIDTPHLIEENGDYSDAFNIICNVNTLLSHIKSTEDVPRLVLFVPIKCEKYYHEGRMEEVTKAIEEQYEVLLTELRSGRKKELYTVAITPILSLGGVVFRDFQRDKDGYVDVVERYDSNNPSLYLRPKAAYYKLYEPAPVFAPKYCEQPVLYVLGFISKQVKDMEGKAADRRRISPGKVVKNFVLSAFACAIGLPPLALLFWTDVFSDKTFVQNASQAAVQLKTAGDGYKILQDPLGIQPNK